MLLSMQMADGPQPGGAAQERPRTNAACSSAPGKSSGWSRPCPEAAAGGPLWRSPTRSLWGAPWSYRPQATHEAPPTAAATAAH